MVRWRREQEEDKESYSVLKSRSKTMGAEAMKRGHSGIEAGFPEPPKRLVMQCSPLMCENTSSISSGWLTLASPIPCICYCPLYFYT